jgi:hypothetical protein
MSQKTNSSLSRKAKMRFTIIGETPSKKNQRLTFYNPRAKRKDGGRGKVINIPSKRYTDWHKQAEKYIPKKQIPDIEGITLEFWFKTNRVTDLTNKAESIMDLMVDCGLILDDTWQITGIVTLIPKGIDKTNPRCRVTIVEKFEDL